MGYLFFPALGPGAAFPELYRSPLAGGWVCTANAWIVGKGAAVYGSFPSLHVLITATLLHHDWCFCRARFWWVVLPVAGLLASTLSLRYHYAVDLLAGLMMFFGLNRLLSRWSPLPT